MPTVTVSGLPAPKGSMKCVGRRGRAGHQLVEDHRVGAKEWRARVTRAGHALLVANDGPLLGPVYLQVTFVLERPKSVPKARRWWPFRKPTADLDKLVRMVADALDDAGVYRDDVQIVGINALKTYPDTPTWSGGPAHRVPGATITVYGYDDPDQLEGVPFRG